MKITNNANLPESLYRAICNQRYEPGVDTYASVTSLLKPVRMFWLQKRHADEIEEDASDMIYTLMGSAIHYVMEMANKDGAAMTEKRLSLKMNGKKISGAIDHYENGVIQDYKFTSVWSWTYKSSLLDWKRQLNMYAYLCYQNGLAVEKLQIVCIFRDWSKSKAKFDNQYPNQVEVIDIPLWDQLITELYISSRLLDILTSEDTPDDYLPLCTPEERWQDPVKYAVMKTGRKSAIKLYDNRDEAEQHAGVTPGGHIEERPSKPKRCAGYCNVAEYCSWYQMYKGEI